MSRKRSDQIAQEMLFFLFMYIGPGMGRQPLRYKFESFPRSTKILFLSFVIHSRKNSSTSYLTNGLYYFIHVSTLSQRQGKIPLRHKCLILLL